MAYLKVKNFFEQIGLGERVKNFTESSATVELAAKAAGCDINQIVKSMTFLVSDEPIMIVCAGNVKIDNAKYKARFREKARMIPAAMVEEYTGHDIGGVCPFAVKPGLKIYFDESLKANETVYPGAGSEHSVVKLTLEELEKCVGNFTWIDVCK